MNKYSFFQSLRGDLAAGADGIFTEMYRQKDAHVYENGDWRDVVKYTYSSLTNTIMNKPNLAMLVICALGKKMSKDNYLIWCKDKSIEEFCALTAFYQLVTPSDFQECIGKLGKTSSVTVASKDKSGKELTSWQIFVGFYMGLVNCDVFNDAFKNEIGITKELVDSASTLVAEMKITNVDILGNMLYSKSPYHGKVKTQRMIILLTGLINATETGQLVNSSLITMRYGLVLKYCCYNEFNGNRLHEIFQGEHTFKKILETAIKPIHKVIEFDDDLLSQLWKFVQEIPDAIAGGTEIILHKINGVKKSDDVEPEKVKSAAMIGDSTKS